MPRIRNILIACGVFWLSLWVSPWFAIVFGKLNSKIIYDDVWYEAIAMGMMISMGRALAAVLACVVITLVVDARHPERWALIVAALYLIDSPVHYGQWHIVPTSWDQLWRAIDFVWPTIACVIAAMVMTRFSRTRTEAPTVSD